MKLHYKLYNKNYWVCVFRNRSNRHYFNFEQKNLTTATIFPGTLFSTINNHKAKGKMRHAT